MKIYVGHSNEWNYMELLYKPILQSNLNERHEIIFPHIDKNNFNTNQTIADSDLFIAEVSMPSLGLGIEIGRAESIGKKILCIYKKGYKCSSSLKYVNADVIEYENEKDMIDEMINYIQIISQNK